MTDVAVIGAEDVVAAEFDDATNKWLLRTSSGDERRARVVIDERQLYTPNIAASSDFRGPSFHTQNLDAAFNPAGRRIAVVGNRAAHVVPKLAGAQLKLFDCPPNWQVFHTKRLRLNRKPKNRPELVPAKIERITPSGIRTADGADHDVDAIIYATGSIATPGLPDDALVGANGLTIQQAWRDGATSYLGVAMHGFPNYFLLQGPDSPVVDGQMRFIDECLQRMKRNNGTRIEVRASAQRQFTERVRITPPARAFEFGEAEHDVYDGPATLTVGADEHSVHVRLAGHLDPIDGKYHWQGTVFGAATGFPNKPVTLTTDGLSTQARITEQTPWGSYSIAGVGAPPYELT